jgi:hypothetical protein
MEIGKNKGRAGFRPEAFARHLGPVALLVGLANASRRMGVRPGVVTALSVTGAARHPWRHGRRGPGRRLVRVGGDQGGSVEHGGSGGISPRWRDTGGVAGPDGDDGVSSTAVCSGGRWW